MKLDLRKIVIPTDFSACAEVALVQALALARLHEAELHLCHVLASYESDPFTPGDPPAELMQFWQRQEESCARKMKALVEELDTGEVPVQLHQWRAGAIAPAIIDRSVELGADLIVMGGHGRRGFRRFLLGSVAEEVVRLASCPVLTVRETSRPWRELHPGRIVVPVDLSEHSKLALRAARELAGAESQLELVHVIDLPVSSQYGDPWHLRPAQADFPALVKQAEEAVASLADEVEGPAVSSHIRVLEGRAAAMLAQHADRVEADLIVIATHGLSGLPHLLMGSVTEKLLRTANCPVLTLKTQPAEGS